MYVSYGDMQTITRLRQEQEITEKDWDSVLYLADPALNGVLRKLKAQGYQPPELGYRLPNDGTREVFVADAAWPYSKIAIVIANINYARPDWKVVRPESFL